jgi:hypothetical protein
MNGHSLVLEGYMLRLPCGLDRFAAQFRAIQVTKVTYVLNLHRIVQIGLSSLPSIGSRDPETTLEK